MMNGDEEPRTSLEPSIEVNHRFHGAMDSKGNARESHPDVSQVHRHSHLQVQRRSENGEENQGRMNLYGNDPKEETCDTQSEVDAAM